MAYKAKEKQVELITVAKNDRGDFIRAARVIPEDTTKSQSVDIRNMYTDSKSGELVLTQKGVRIPSEHLPALLAVIVSQMPEDEREKFNECLAADDKLSSEKEEEEID